MNVKSQTRTRKVLYIVICYAIVMLFSLGYIYERKMLYSLGDVHPVDTTAHKSSTIQQNDTDISLKIRNPTAHKSSTVQLNDTDTSLKIRNPHQVECNFTPALLKSNLPDNSILQHVPDSMLKNREAPRVYPACDLISPWELVNSSAPNMEYNENWILVLVKSAPQNIRRRSAIRRTWGSVRSIGGRTMFTVFVVARTGDQPGKQNALEQENKVYGDMLQCDFQDSYVNLPLKVLSMMGWVLSNDVPAKFVMMTDDDVAIKIPAVHNFFLSKENLWKERHAYCGYAFSSKAGPIRNVKSKWHMPADIYPGTKYPTFCNGPNYSMTKSLMHDLFCIASITDYDGFYLEDVLITGIIRAKLNSDKDNIHPGGGFIQYFWNQKGGVQNMVLQTWNKWKATDPELKKLLSAPDTVTEPFDKDTENVVGIEKYWDSV